MVVPVSTRILLSLFEPSPSLFSLRRPIGHKEGCTELSRNALAWSKVLAVGISAYLSQAVSLLTAWQMDCSKSNISQTQPSAMIHWPLCLSGGLEVGPNLLKLAKSALKCN